MNEKFLQNLWKNKVFNPLLFKDTDGNSIEILDFGQLNTDAGPDFHSAKIRMHNLIFFGNIEFHTKSSDWLLHRHSQQKSYQSIILHIVFEHDQEIPFLKEKNIPTLELKNYISEEIFKQYDSKNGSRFILCEEIFEKNRFPDDFLEQIIVEKLENKHLEIKYLLEKTKNDYEAILFQKISYAFGLKVNASVFFDISQNLDFKVIKKVSQNPFQLESLLFGKADLLQSEEAIKWKKEFKFLTKKFQLDEQIFPAKFLRMMPVSFPTIRLSQLSQLYFHHQNLFSKIINAKNIRELKTLFSEIKTSEYWENHYIFGKETTKKTKKLSDDFINILILNAILPVIYSYHREKTDIQQFILSFYQEMKSEKNTIVNQWKNLGIEMKSALDSQSFIYFHKKWCLEKKCLNCWQIQHKTNTKWS